MPPPLRLPLIHILHHPRSFLLPWHQQILHHLVPFAELLQFLGSEVQVLRVLVVGQAGKGLNRPEPLQQLLLPPFVR